jgi:hypothetical protein
MRLLVTDDSGRVFLIVRKLQDLDLTDPEHRSAILNDVDTAMMDMEAYDDFALAGPRALVSDTHHRLTAALVERAQPCEGCIGDGHEIDGIRWPTAANGDESRAWIERCDTCERYPNDDAAAWVLMSEGFEIAEAIPAGSQHPQPYTIDPNEPEEAR